MTRKQLGLAVCAGIFLCVSLMLSPRNAWALDTDIYKVNSANNCYMLLDNSGSMSFGVYEHTIDYGAMFDYLFTLNDDPAGDYDDYIYDTINNSSYFYQNHQERRKIYLWRGDIGVTIAHVDGRDIAFTGDAADPDYLWYMSYLIDTHTLIDENGDLADDGTGQQRITVDADGYILLDGNRLPLGQDITLHELQTLYDGSVVDRGFGGLLNAPGYYFSGYEGVNIGNLDVAEDGDTSIYFFVTGNWVNMQAMYNLHYTTNSGLPAGAGYGDMAWVYEDFPITEVSWQQLGYALKYPDPGAGDPVYVHPQDGSCPVNDPWCWSQPGDITYINNLNETDTSRIITHPGATRMQVHFASFDVENDGDPSTFNYDYVAIYDGAGSLLARYDNDNNPVAGDGWSVTVDGDTVVIKLASDIYRHSKGYEIDKIRVVYSADAGGGYYRMQSRLDVAKDAMTYVVQEFMGRINWGFATFGKNAWGYAEGADIKATVNFNPSDQDDLSGNELINQISQVTAGGGTPLGEALQDLFINGYYQHSNAIDNHPCRKNFIISMTDGFPSADDDWTRIQSGTTTITMQDWDGDGWTNDPYQYQDPPPDYYDDVAHWLYTHSWFQSDEFAEVQDPASSYRNIITHHISFGAYHPLLEDAAGESGGMYIATYNKEQLVSAFHSLGLMIAEAVSFTAPVVSVDAANKIQSGDDLYMGLFLPKDGQSWVGNLKKFKLGDGSADRPDLWMIYDGANNEAIDSQGAFLDNTSAFWGDDNDPNDADNNGAADIMEDGAGEVLTERVAASFQSGDYYEREIYTYKNGQIVAFHRDNITAADLGVADDSARDKLVNFVYGYTYDADPTTGAPMAVRNWALGAIIHSRPVVIDYYDTSDPDLPLLKRYIAVGANDGMLHIFDDTTGQEVFAFIPENILPQLKMVQLDDFHDTVDGAITLYRRDGQPKYLIFGTRRGGNTYWCLDVSNTNPLLWSVKWQYTNSETVQTWAEVQIATIPVAVDPSTGQRTYKDVAVLTGGYDPEEDNFPEPFADIDNDGTPYDADGNLKTTGATKEWDSTDIAFDVFDNDMYDTFNPEMNEHGRGIFVVDIDDPSNVVVNPINTSENLLPFSVTYGATDVTTGATWTLSSMKFCFPATPSLVTLTETYQYKLDGVVHRGYQDRVLRQLYASDVYANVFKVSFESKVAPDPDTGEYRFETLGWDVRKVFSANPGSLSASGSYGGGEDTGDQGRKTFHSPAVSWGGSGDYFDSANYLFPHTEFSGTDRLATLFFGTGDREHPRYTMIRNRMYAVYDDSSVTGTQYSDEDGSLLGPVTVSTSPYNENDLLNLTADEFGDDALITSCYLGSLGGQCDETADVDGDGDADAYDITIQMRQYLADLLTDDAIYTDTLGLTALEEGIHEDDVKGWYIVLEDQTLGSDHMQYPGTLEVLSDASRDNHVGEKILGKPVIYYKNVYFTSYQPSYDDPCNPQGNGFVYALSYLDGSATLNLNTTNDSAGGTNLDMTDRYRKYTGIYGIPSGFTVITRNGRAGAMASMGGTVVGPGEEPGPGYEIPTPGVGLELYYWREGRTR